MPGLYKSDVDRQADVLLANANIDLRWRPTASGKMTLESTSPLEREVMREEQVEALARIAVDDAMRR